MQPQTAGCRDGVKEAAMGFPRTKTQGTAVHQEPLGYMSGSFPSKRQSKFSDALTYSFRLKREERAATRLASDCATACSLVEPASFSAFIVRTFSSQ